jgi:hypothetical protein
MSGIVEDDGPSSGGYTGRSPRGMAGRLGSGPALGPPLFVLRTHLPPSFPRKRESTHATLAAGGGFPLSRE